MHVPPPILGASVYIPLSINIAIKRSRLCLVINAIRNPIRKPEYGKIALTINVR